MSCSLYISMDLIIIGAGPAGLSAAIYAKTFGIECLVFDNPNQLSQMTMAHEISNYSGFEKIHGMDLLNKMKAQVKDLGIEIIEESVVRIEKGKVITQNKNYDTKSILLATGTTHRKANIPGEDNFLGRGVSYCYVCDGPIFAGKDVIIYGGGDSAFKAALYFAELKSKVTLIHRRDEFRAANDSVERAKKLGVKFALKHTIKEIVGDKLVSNVILDDGSEIKCTGVFIMIGEIPTVELAKQVGVEVNENNFIIVDKEQKTNIDGIYAAGDVTDGIMKQVATAVGDGARAVFSINKYLRS